jgi:hypothetical protein
VPSPRIFDLRKHRVTSIAELRPAYSLEANITQLKLERLEIPHPKMIRVPETCAQQTNEPSRPGSRSEIGLVHENLCGVR